MAEGRLCPKCLKANLHRYTAHSIKSTGQGIERLKEETYWRCVSPGCEYREEEGIESPSDSPPLSSSPRETTNLRSWTRFPVELSSSVSSTGPEWDGTVVNLSRQGCAIHSTTPVKSGDNLHMLIYPGANQTPIEVEVAEVRWALNEQFGVEFVSLAPAEAIRLERLLTIVGKE